MHSGGRKQGSAWWVSGVATVFPSLIIVLKRLGPFCVACLRLLKGRCCACCSSTCMRAYEPTIKPILTLLTVRHLLFLFRRSKGFVSQRDDSESVCVPVVLEHIGGTRQYDFHLSLRLASSARLRVSDGARRTCFDRWHARVSTVERQSEGNSAYHDTTMSQSAGETRTPRSWIDS